jgi:uncharacterized SAM-binding protein YcdF (DUF218 family)
MAMLRAFSNPATWILLLLISGIFLLRGSHRQLWLKTGWYLVVLGTSVLYLLSISPASNGLVYYLDSQYQPPSKEIIAHLDIVVILNGGVTPPREFSKSPEASGATYSRVFNGVEIFKQSSAKILVLSGAGDEQGSNSTSEVMKNLAIKLGVSADKIVTESRSLHTMGHAIELAKIFPPKEGMKIGIVTSALHIPRSVYSFQKRFPPNTIIPIPVGYSYSSSKYGIKSLIPSAHTLSQSSYAIHELIGIIGYRLFY